MNTFNSTIRVDSELRDRLKKQAPKNLTTLNSLPSYLILRKIRDMVSKKKVSEVCTSHFQKTTIVNYGRK